MTIETEQESDGRWIAEILEHPGVMAYGTTEKRAIDAAYELYLEAIVRLS